MSIKKLSLLTVVILFSVSLTPAAPTWSGMEPDWSGNGEGQQPRKQKSDENSTVKDEKDGGEWFARAYELHQSDRYPEAIAAFKRAIDLGYRKSTSMYNIACGYSLLNDKENALIWLQRALDNGFDGAELLAEDSDLDPLRSDSRFHTLTASARVTEKLEKYSERKRDRLEQATFEFERLERTGSRDGEEWSSIGRQLLSLRDLNHSIIALTRAVNHLGYQGNSAKYNLACAYALAGDSNAGIEWLAKAVASGFDSPDKVQNDPDLNNLRTDSRFAQIEKSSKVLSLSQFFEGFSDDASYPKRQWIPAVDLYQSLVKSEPGNGRAWFNLGFALHYTAEHMKAIDAFTRARELGYNPPVSMYNIACAYSMLKQRDQAFESLKKAFDEGYNLGGYLTGDRDLDNLRSDPRFKQFVSMARKRKEEK